MEWTLSGESSVTVDMPLHGVEAVVGLNKISGLEGGVFSLTAVLCCT